MMHKTDIWTKAIDSVMHFMKPSENLNEIPGHRYFVVNCDVGRDKLLIHNQNCKKIMHSSKTHLLGLTKVVKDSKSTMIYYFESIVSAFVFCHILKYSIKEISPNYYINIEIASHKAIHDQCLTSEEIALIPKWF
jgi:hypothetical protein